LDYVNRAEFNDRQVNILAALKSGVMKKSGIKIGSYIVAFSLAYYGDQLIYYILTSFTHEALFMQFNLRRSFELEVNSLHCFVVFYSHF
jgi:hypothetical protein